MKSARDSPISSKLVFEVKDGSVTASRTASRSPKSEPVEENALSGEEHGEGSEVDQGEPELPERTRGINEEAAASQSPVESKKVGHEDDDAEMNENVKEEDGAMDLDPGSPEPSELAYPDSPVKAQAHKKTPPTTTPHLPQPSPSVEPLAASSKASQPGEIVDATVAAPPQPERPALKATPSEPCINPALLTKHHNAIIIPAPVEPSLSSSQFTDAAIAPLPDHPQTV